jgi:hypothetical protein
MSHWTETARDHPLTTAAAAAGAAAAGVFLWSRRNQISDQIGRLSNQFADWTESMQAGANDRELALAEGSNESSAIGASRATAARRSASKSRGTNARKTSSSTRGMSPTGGGNASLGAHTGTTGTGVDS